MLEVDKNTFTVALGTGDIHMILMKTEQDKYFVLIRPWEEGAIGDAEVTGRIPPDSDNYKYKESGKSELIISTTSPESLDQLLVTLLELREKVPGALDDRVLELTKSLMEC